MSFDSEKRTIRELFLQARMARLGTDYVEMSRQLSERLYQLCRNEKYEVIHTFLPLTSKGEPDISLFINTALCDGLKLIVPEVVRDQLEMRHHRYQLETQLHDGHWGVSVPKGDDVIDPRLSDAVLVPMLAVDKNGYRVGYGKGYYDYFLSKMNAVFIGVCFDDEIIDAVPREAHDVPVHYIVSDKRVQKVTNGANIS
jgi:5-formyltetrahydrofolate cyclo-ligase